MSLRKRLFGLATALAVGLLGLAGAGTASADDAPIRRAPVQPVYSLTVHKYLGATTDLDHNGSELSADKLTGKSPLGGG